MSKVPCLAEAEDPDNSQSTGAWLWSSSILFIHFETLNFLIHSVCITFNFKITDSLMSRYVEGPVKRGLFIGMSEGLGSSSLTGSSFLSFKPPCCQASSVSQVPWPPIPPPACCRTWICQDILLSPVVKLPASYLLFPINVILLVSDVLSVF